MSIKTPEPYDFAAEVIRLNLKQPFPEPYWQGWDHQLVGRAFVKHKKRCIGAIDKGMGKTSWALSIFEDPEVHKNVPGFTVIIFTNEKGMAAYRRDIEKFPEHKDKIQLVYGQQKHQRAKRWRENPNAKYFIVTYDSFQSDCGFREVGVQGARRMSEIIVPAWALDKVSTDAVICDEFHRKFRRHKSKTFKMLKALFGDIKYFIPMSGSATDKGPQDLWAALHLCDRRFWSSYWAYVDMWCEKEMGWTGHAKISGPKLSALPKWRALMKHWVFRVRAEDVADMPPKTREFLEVTMPPWQKKLHDDLMNKMHSETPDGDFLIMRNSLERNHNARLSLICPKALDPAYGVGQGIEDIADDAQDGGVKQYAVFTPFRAPIPHLERYLIDRGCGVWVLQGGIGLDEQEQRLAAWRASLSSAHADKPSVILCTIKYAESWEIPAARYGYFLGEEYVREDNLQAEDRLRRLISVGNTFIQYARFSGTLQEDIITSLLDKAENDRAMHSRWVNLRARGMIGTT